MIKEVKKEMKKGVIERVSKINPEEGLHKYGEVKYADPKNKKYPIDTREHVEAAARYFGKESNRDEYKKGRVIIQNRINAAKMKFGIK